MRALAYYCTAHGYGHGVRSTDIVRAFNALRPEVPVYVVTDLPELFLRNRLSSPANRYRLASFDVGMVQLDSIRVDVPATLQRVEALDARRNELLRAEVEFLRDANVGGIVVDIPGLPLEAAVRARIPRLAVGNFSWDWIYSEFAARDPRWEPLVRRFAEDYGKADLLLRLPFADEMLAFRRREEIPLVASPGRDRRGELAARTGADPARRWVLLSFTTLDWDAAALDRLTALAEYEFFTVAPLIWRRRNIHPVDREEFPFTDVIATADGVVSKPGFGIVSECVVNRKPLLYAERTDFLEYAVLVDGVRRYLSHAHIAAARLYAGDLGEALDRLWRAAPPAQEIAAGGAPLAARRIAELTGL